MPVVRRRRKSALARPPAPAPTFGPPARMCAGQVVMPQGTPLTPAAIGVLAGLNYATVPVHARPIVAIFSTGDELRQVGQSLGPGQIYDSNSHALVATAEQYGARAVRLTAA